MDVEGTPPQTPTLRGFERVSCLECGTSYLRALDGGTVAENPGCPSCGYLGWVRDSRRGVREIRAVSRRRFGVGPTLQLVPR
jgi:hypothetical protein